MLPTVAVGAVLTPMRAPRGPDRRTADSRTQPTNPLYGQFCGQRRCRLRTVDVRRLG
jgi:hypothetical protein